MADGQAGTGGGRRFDEDTLGLLAESAQVDIEAGSGATRLPPRTIWLVVVDGEVYVRSYKGTSGPLVPARARRRRRRIPVELHAVSDRSLLRAVSDAYREKYMRGAPYETNVMLASDAEVATLHVVPLMRPRPAPSASRANRRR